jgi:DNA repair protein RadC
MKTIDQLHRYDKPREKLAARGAQALKNDELMAVLLGSGVRGKDVRKLSRETIFIGTLNRSLVHPREVFADAIADRAAGIIIAHNHPSGVLDASHADRQITQRLKEVSTLVGIELLDHVILTLDGYVSFSDEGWL